MSYLWYHTKLKGLWRLLYTVVTLLHKLWILTGEVVLLVFVVTDTLWVTWPVRLTPLGLLVCWLVEV